MKPNLKKIRKYALRLFYAIASVYLLILVLMFFTQEKLLFHPVKIPTDHTFNLTTASEEKWTNVDGTQIHSLYLKQNDPKGLILYFHGNGCNINQCASTVDELSQKTNWDVWIVDYPGYGKSEGAISSEPQLHRLADEIYKEALTLNPKKIVIYGRSLGTGIATHLASKIDSNLNQTKNIISGVVLETPYLSIKNLALKQYPFVPAILLKYHLRSDLWIKEIKSKTLMLHGTMDSLIPLSQATQLLDVAQKHRLCPEQPCHSNLELVIIKNGHHDDLSKFNNYWTSINSFLKTL